MYRTNTGALLLLLCIFGSISSSDVVGGRKTLVMLESESLKVTHSLFFKSLEERGYLLTYHTPREQVPFRTYGEWNYDNLILFAPSADELPMSAKSVLEFIDEGHNVLLVGGSNLGKPLRDIASDCNIEFDEDGTFATDHFNFDGSDFDGQHNVLALDPKYVVSANIVFPQKIDAPVLYKGIAQDIEEDSALLFSVLSGTPTTYSAAPEEKITELHVAGRKTSLVTALQARNNARVIFAGSLELFSDKFFKSPVQKISADGKTQNFDKSGNELFVKQLSQWVFQERGILRAINVQHHRVGEKEAPATYTIKEDLAYSVEIQEWNGKKWIPYLADDVQLEFRMLDPYVRIALKHDANGKYFTTFKIPDVYGVFTFKIEYVRKGYGFLNSITRTPVRPFRHNEYERFIESAYPYYASAFSLLVGLWVFSWFFLYHKERK
jgi:oligosaccharyltransferase complex subunit beta